MHARFSRIGLTAALLVFGGQAAHAQHVVTEAEASKLTLEALTATPPPPRPIYRAYYRPAMSVRTIHGHAVRRRMAEPVSYRPAAHHASHHRRR